MNRVIANFILNTSLIVLLSLLVSNISILLFCILITIIVLLLTISFKEIIIILNIQFVGITFSIFLYYYYLNTYGTPYFNELPSDDYTYELYAINVMAKSFWYEYFKITDELIPSGHNSPGYIFLVSLLARITEHFGGFNTFIPKLFNISLHAYSSVLLYRILIKYHHIKPSISLFFTYSYGLFPYLIFLSAHTFRSIIVSSSFIIIYYIGIKKKNSILKILVSLSVSCLIILFLFDIRVFSALALTGVIYVLYKNESKYQINNIIPIIAIIVIVYFLFFYQTYSSNSLFDRLIVSQVRYNEYRASLSAEGGLAEIIINIPLFPFGWIVRSFYFMITPVSFLSTKLPDLYVGIGTIFQLYLYNIIFLAYTKKIFINKWENIIMWTLLVSISISSFEPRHLTMLYPFLFMVAASYINYFHINKINYKRDLLVITFIYSLLPILYIIYKF